jgi:hypothetical protein
MQNTDSFIMSRVEKHYNYLKEMGYNVVAIFAQGSMNYGLYINDETYKSDVDTKAIVLPSLDDLIKGIKTSVKYQFENEQIDVKDFRLMSDIWAKANPAYLELLFTKYMIINPMFQDIMKNILDMKEDIVKMNYVQLARCIQGMSLEKVKALKHNSPSQEEVLNKFNYAPKQLHHIRRLNLFLIDIFYNKKSFGDAMDLTGREELDELIKMKLGKFSEEEATKLASYYDSDTNLKVNEILDLYSDFKFNSKTLNTLNDIIFKAIKQGVICDIRKQGDEI